LAAVGARWFVVPSHVDAVPVEGPHPLDHEPSARPRVGHRHHRPWSDAHRRTDQEAVAGLEIRPHAHAGDTDPAHRLVPRSRRDGERGRHGGQAEAPPHLDYPAAGRDVGMVILFATHHQGASLMTIVTRLLRLADWLSEPETIHAHCDLPCGVYDPAQARIEAQAIKGIMERFNQSDDNVFKIRAVIIKEQRAELLKHHLWVLWTDYFTPSHLEKYPQLHELFWNATKTAGEAKKTTDVAVAESLLGQVAEIDKIFWETKG
jgi:nickel superoxide dismutase